MPNEEKTVPHRCSAAAATIDDGSGAMSTTSGDDLLRERISAGTQGRPPQLHRVQVDGLLVYTTKPETVLTRVSNLPSDFETKASAQAAGIAIALVQLAWEVGTYLYDKWKDSQTDKGQSPGKEPEKRTESTESTNFSLELSVSPEGLKLKVDSESKSNESSSQGGGGKADPAGQVGGGTADPAGQGAGGKADPAGQVGGGAADPAGQGAGGKTDPADQGGGGTDPTGQSGGGKTDPAGQGGGGKADPAGQDTGGTGAAHKILVPDGAMPVGTPAHDSLDQIMRQALSLSFPDAASMAAYMQQAADESGITIKITSAGIEAESKDSLDPAGIARYLRERGVRDEAIITNAVKEVNGAVASAETFVRGAQATFAAKGSQPGASSSSTAGAAALVSSWRQLVPAEYALTYQATTATDPTDLESSTPPGQDQTASRVPSSLTPAALLSMKAETPSGFVLTATVSTEIHQRLLTDVAEGYHPAPFTSVFETSVQDPASPVPSINLERFRQGRL